MATCLSRAYVPAQTLNNGTVRITVIEARYDTITLRNSSRVHEALLRSLLSAQKPGRPVAEGPLAQSVSLLADVPGAVVSSTLAPGSVPGTSNLEVKASSGARYSGSLSLDDAGNRYTGRVRASGTFNWNDPAGQGDVLSLTGLTAGPDLNYARVGYQMLLDDGLGTGVGAALSALHYSLGHGLDALDAHGTARVATVSASQPLIRSSAGNLLLQLALDDKQLHDDVDSTLIDTDRHVDVLSILLAGDRRDTTGISNGNLGVSVGRVSFENDEAELIDQTGAHVRGSFAKLSLSFARLQSLTSTDSLYVALNAQAANKNLDTSEQFFLGGPNSVRAYEVGTVGGAQGGLLTAELRHPAIARCGCLASDRVRRFGDGAHLQDTFAPGPNSATLSGGGAGMNWAIGAGAHRSRSPPRSVVAPGSWATRAHCMCGQKCTGPLIWRRRTATSRLWREYRRQVMRGGPAAHTLRAAHQPKFIMSAAHGDRLALPQREQRLTHRHRRRAHGGTACNHHGAVQQRPRHVRVDRGQRA